MSIEDGNLPGFLGVRWFLGRRETSGSHGGGGGEGGDDGGGGCGSVRECDKVMLSCDGSEVRRQ